MNLDELRSVQSTERQTDSLQNLRPSFYQEVGEYIADLEAERDRAATAAADPFASPEVRQLTDEIETARDVVEAIYERRMGKLVKQASLSAAGMSADDDGLTAEEQDLFADLVDRIQSNKNRVLETLEGTETGSDGPTADPAGPADDPTAPDPDRTDPAQLADRARSTDGDQAATGEPSETPPTPPAASAPESRSPEGEPAHESTTDTPEEGAAEPDGLTPADVMGSASPSVEDDPSEPAESGADPAPTPPPDIPGPDSDRETPSRAEEDQSTVEGDPSTAPADREQPPGPSPPTDTAHEEPAVDRMTVKITRNIGSILGVDDREYTLAAEDIVTLPEQNATPLVEQDAAEPIE